MLIGGEKYACHACVRGHRVSNCRHADRPLLHINKKGRPPSLCTHCRTIYRSRKRKIRCSCGGEKTPAEGASTYDWDSQEDCCCSNITRSASTLPREELDLVTGPDNSDTSYSPALGNGTHEHRAVEAQPKDYGTGFPNSYHMPMHKRNYTDHSNLTIISTLDGKYHTEDTTVSAEQEQRMVVPNHGLASLTSASDIDLMSGLQPSSNLSSFATDCTYQYHDMFSPLPDHEQLMYFETLSVDCFNYDDLGSNNEHSP